jgi:carbon storage regulator
MLVLSRKVGEKIYIGNDISITVVEVQGNRVKVGIEAPENQRILRGELAFGVEAPESSGAAKSTQKKQRHGSAVMPVARQAALVEV